MNKKVIVWVLWATCIAMFMIGVVTRDVNKHKKGECNVFCN